MQGIEYRSFHLRVFDSEAHRIKSSKELPITRGKLELFLDVVNSSGIETLMSDQFVKKSVF